MSKHVVICGAGATLATPIIRQCVMRHSFVTALCHHTLPELPPFSSDLVKVIDGVDLTSAAIIADKIRTIRDIDVLITLPGRVSNSRIDEMLEQEWHKVLDANLTTVFNSLSVFLPKMIEGGNVVVVGSIVGSTGGFGCSNYAAAKAGLVGLVRAAANEYAHRNVKVNLLELGYIDEGMGKRLPHNVREKVLLTIPLKRFGASDDFVKAVDFLSSTNYMTGGVLTLAGGLR